MGLLQLVRDSGSQSARVGRSAQPRYGVFGLDAESEARHESGDVRTAAALLATLGLAAVCWVVAIRRMNGMDMGVATTLGSFGFFVGVWVTMMAAMMLPGAAPAVVRRARSHDGARAVPQFVASYLAVWTLVGVAVYALYRPHGTVTAGVVVIAAGVYELTPLKRRFRRRCRERLSSGLGFGLCCVGSSIGLMAVMLALGVMSVTWMAVIAVARPRSEVGWRQSRDRRAARNRDRRIWGPDRRGPLVGSRADGTDVRATSVFRTSRTMWETERRQNDEWARDWNA